MTVAKRDRTHERETRFSEIDRIVLLEGDADLVEYQLEQFRAEVREEFKAIRNILSKLLWAVVGALISVTTSTIVIYFTRG